jgi:hypothetical protein
LTSNTQNEDLGVFGAVASTTQHKKIQHEAHKTIEEDGSRDDVGKPRPEPVSSDHRRKRWPRTSYRHPPGSSGRPPTTPTMAAAIENYLWTINEMIERLD